jgi:branched-chain amino acid transport system permease protein
MAGFIEQTIISGLLYGIIAALIALGFTLVLSILDLANFAHGNQVMLAMYVALVASQYLHLSPFAASAIIAPAMFLVGLLLYRVMVHALIGRTQTTHVAATIGLMLFLENLVNLFFGGTTQSVPPPFANASVPILSTYVPLSQLLGAAIAAVAVVGLYLVLNYTDFGLTVRACADNLVGARVSGLPVQRIYAIAFALSVAAAGLAGTVLAAYQPMTPFVGGGFLSMAFAVVVLAGAGNLMGTIVSGLAIGLIQSTSQAVFSASIGDTVLFAIIILALFVRPQGLFTRA